MPLFLSIKTDEKSRKVRKQYELNGPLYKKRAEVVAKIPHFWALVLETAPPDIDNFIQPSDSKIFADCLETLDVIRFEIDEPNGSPRSFAIKFGFSDNEYFEDKVLEKKFWYRVSSDWEGLVSEPVKINWKKGKDITEGVTDAAVKLFKARAANVGSGTEDKDLPAYKELVKLIEQSDEASNNFFTWFAFVSSYKFITAEESAIESKKKAERIEKQRRGEKVEDLPEIDHDPTLDVQEAEAFLQGDELATLIADDLWPSAIKYFKHAHEAEDDDEELSDLSVDYGDEDGDDSDEDIDIRALVGKGRPGSSGSPPPNPKKARKA
ncbi:hypothetical protein BU24DRAFT_416845 [Aaosphaeria arxii CBS 175.79]|uniref:NAP family protein n=1 Tax=Aaosphaeria arxii CBS 175.79 TaxID=1450172 RepID=A0A6A5Y8P0_9PLEO|nr:uncharacterized protein BU24DRAFT_416845 [Aaosphaeria arxii CBS 175.79]KAF2021180.1 hypothetical protein BU24DRAFT_416845 [Aaosphaeria arxii CBS 175.79]